MRGGYPGNRHRHRPHLPQHRHTQPRSGTGGCAHPARHGPARPGARCGSSGASAARRPPHSPAPPPPPAPPPALKGPARRCSALCSAMPRRAAPAPGADGVPQGTPCPASPRGSPEFLRAHPAWHLVPYRASPTPQGTSRDAPHPARPPISLTTSHPFRVPQIPLHPAGVSHIPHPTSPISISHLPKRHLPRGTPYPTLYPASQMHLLLHMAPHILQGTPNPAEHHISHMAPRVPCIVHSTPHPPGTPCSPVLQSYDFISYPASCMAPHILQGTSYPRGHPSNLQAPHIPHPTPHHHRAPRIPHGITHSTLHPTGASRSTSHPAALVAPHILHSIPNPTASHPTPRSHHARRPASSTHPHSISHPTSHTCDAPHPIPRFPPPASPQGTAPPHPLCDPKPHFPTAWREGIGGQQPPRSAPSPGLCHAAVSAPGQGVKVCGSALASLSR